MNQKNDQVCVKLGSILAGNFKGISYSELYGDSQDLVMRKWGKQLYDGMVAAMYNQCRQMNSMLIDHVVQDTILEVTVEAWLSFKHRFMMISDALKYVDVVHVRKTNAMVIRDVCWICVVLLFDV